jgi:hypothetical protein
MNATARNEMMMRGDRERLARLAPQAALAMTSTPGRYSEHLPRLAIKYSALLESLQGPGDAGKSPFGLPGRGGLTWRSPTFKPLFEETHPRVRLLLAARVTDARHF